MMRIGSHCPETDLPQPLVENALYHGIKTSGRVARDLGAAKKSAANRDSLEVEDNGIGFTPDKLAQLQSELKDDFGDARQESRFRHRKWKPRLRLYYGKQYGLSVKSEYETVGTCVSFTIPARMADETEDARAIIRSWSRREKSHRWSGRRWTE